MILYPAQYALSTTAKMLRKLDKNVKMWISMSVERAHATSEIVRVYLCEGLHKQLSLSI